MVDLNVKAIKNIWRRKSCRDGMEKLPISSGMFSTRDLPDLTDVCCTDLE